MFKNFLKRALLFSAYMLFPIGSIMAQNNTLQWDKTALKYIKAILYFKHEV